MDPDRLESGGSPALGEPLAIEFADTRYAVRGVVQEGLARPEHLGAWLRDHAGAFDAGAGAAAARAVRAGDLARFIRLRDAIRDVARLLVDGKPPAPERLGVLNAAAAAAPRRPLLRWDETGPTVVEATEAPAVDAALAAIARSAIEVFGGPLRPALRACGGPGCVLFFVKNHPRREWCSPGCGNRARVDRHYKRHRARQRD